MNTKSATTILIAASEFILQGFLVMTTDSGNPWVQFSGAMASLVIAAVVLLVALHGDTAAKTETRAATSRQAAGDRKEETGEVARRLAGISVVLGILGIAMMRRK